ncbi:MAG TPA: TlpA disulfide reductase family protein, partial [Gemmatimonadales bacterium]|nr:TlpA disulfide reductase family protein [Gemmatimonadales bacterium]
MSKQWAFVGAVVMGLLLGGAALVWYGPEVEQVAAGAKAPNFRVVDLQTGDTVAIRDRYRGHVTLVNIWATWCVPCRVEMPSMERLYDSLGSRGFRIAAVSIDQEGPEVVRQFGSDLGLTFDLLQDRTMAIQQAYQTTGVPESFLLDTNGVIMKRVIGAHDWSSPVNRALVRRLMGDTAGGLTLGDSAATDPVP